MIPLNELLNAMQKAKDFLFAQIEKGASKNQDEIAPNLQKKVSLQHFDSSRFQKNIHIYSHLDADGLSAAAIMAKMFTRENIGFQITILNQLESQYIATIAEEISKYNRFIVLTDFGSGQYEILKEKLKTTDFLILDHHKPEKIDNPPEINHINPYFYDIRGEDEISGAGICYLFSKIMNEKNQDLAALAIVGAIGDMQNNNDKSEFKGINQKILQEAMNDRKIILEKNIAISRTRPLIQSLIYSLPLEIEGLSGSYDGVVQFLNRINIQATDELNHSRTLIDLSEMEKKTLTNALIQYALVEKGISTDDIKKLVTTFYILTDFDPKISVSDAREMSSLLNACGRRGKQGVGIAALLGNAEALTDAMSEKKDYKKELSRAIQSAKKQIREYEYIRTVYDNTIDERIIGTICSILIHSDLQHDKPLIAFADSDNHFLKVSSRANRELLDKGLDLGIVMRKACQQLKIQNPAGGHPPAAGAKIKTAHLKDFIEKVNEFVKEQIG
ncbi:hypothetical protein NEF87_001816 [Candidatus Lokiarchaeum ossiferum]|uniref:DHH family phosphoesterase n=1 Tax=Candidatus Lokiarchaeum ossiferum TaxID=2951803 RepID=A0ABY6HQ26_9ARCH|nr:hypothetical protein NEF87_001816 [Candidatus Lokiarchaeum sp. B-35]